MSALAARLLVLLWKADKYVSAIEPRSTGLGQPLRLRFPCSASEGRSVAPAAHWFAMLLSKSGPVTLAMHAGDHVSRLPTQ